MNDIRNIVVKVLYNFYISQEVSYEDLEFLFKEYCCTENNKNLEDTKKLFDSMKFSFVLSKYMPIVLKHYSKKFNIISLHSKEGNIIQFY